MPYRLSRPFAAPPGVPEERARALQAAFLAVHNDPLYREDAARLKVDISPISGPDVMRAVDDIAGGPADMLAVIGKIMSDTKGGGEVKR